MESKRFRLIVNELKMEETFNRTSMESKLFSSVRISTPENTFNRTSMESKPVRVKGVCIPNKLLIEPVWNRNRAKVQLTFSCIQSTFNRTSMESKLRQIQALLDFLETFNRTSMESKLVCPFWIASHACLTFNRTSMESKRGNAG